ncbi:MAG TPA: hypothetical protein VHB68_11030 [Steroidobacteraceae bacterium]|nr:hypothetical protein [Steroidobacteraceae bacterium]
MKLSSTPVRSVSCWCLAGALALLSACETTPSQQVVEHLDSDTGTTVIALAQPVELLSDSLRGAAGDPFAYVAPFETDRMGKHAQYLWIAAPSISGAKLNPQLICDGEPLLLEPMESSLKSLGMSKAPYETPAPWDQHWYFELPRDVLHCLSNAQSMGLDTHADDGETQHFAADNKGLTRLKAFGNR